MSCIQRSCLAFGNEFVDSVEMRIDVIAIACATIAMIGVIIALIQNHCCIPFMNSPGQVITFIGVVGMTTVCFIKILTVVLRVRENMDKVDSKE